MYRKPLTYDPTVPRVMQASRIPKSLKDRMDAFARERKITMQDATEILIDTALKLVERGELQIL